MPSFEYQVKDRTGKDQKGVEEAPDVGTLVETLRAQGFIIVRINEIQEKKVFLQRAGEEKGEKRTR